MRRAWEWVSGGAVEETKSGRRVTGAEGERVEAKGELRQQQASTLRVRVKTKGLESASWVARISTGQMLAGQSRPVAHPPVAVKLLRWSRVL
eukprot:6187138-Pleurochrysis_carterae.AAC.6